MNALRKNRPKIWRLAGLAALVCGMLLGSVPGAVPPAAAQPLSTQEKSQLEARKEALFQVMLRNPADLDATFAYAEVSTRLGDYEAAVSALERMLLFNPNLPRVDLELGALYFRMGSYDLARDYFAKAAAGNPPPEVKARIADYTAQIEKASSRHHFSGYLFLGGQFQSDANVAGSSFLGGFLLNNAFVKHPSGSVFASGALLYSYDLEDQRRDTIDVTATGYMNHYFNNLVSRLDLALLEVTGGPRFNFPSGLLGNILGSVKPYIIADEVGLGEAQYFAAIGTGIEYDETVWNDMLLKTVFEFRQKNFTNTPDRPLSTGLNGSDKLVTFSLDKPTSANTDLNLQFTYLDQTTELPFYTNSTYAVSGTYNLRYNAPHKLTPYPWETSFFLGRAWSNYAAPDPCCEFLGLGSQLTQRWRFGITQAIPVSPRVAIVLQLERDIVSSNLPIYAYTNNSVLLGPQINF